MSNKIKISKNILFKYYFIKNLSAQQIGDIYNCSHSTILDKLYNNGFIPRNHSEANLKAGSRISRSLKAYFKNLSEKERQSIYTSVKKGKEHFSWKKLGSFHFSQFGKYKLIKVGHNNWRAEHRILVENYLNRKLKKNEVIHHIDENTHNNNLNNLYVFSKRGYHSAFTVLAQNKIISLSVLKSNLLILKKYKRYS